MDPTGGIVAQLQQAGLLGACVIALGYMLLKKDAKVQELQEKRVVDAQKYAEGLQQATGLIRDHTKVLERLADAQEGK